MSLSAENTSFLNAIREQLANTLAGQAGSSIVPGTAAVSCGFDTTRKEYLLTFKCDIQRPTGAVESYGTGFYSPNMIDFSV